MLQGDISSGRKHPRAHELVGGIGLFPPEDVRQDGKSQFDERLENPDMIGIQGKLVIDTSGGVPDIDTGEPSIFENPEGLLPDCIEFPVHCFKGLHSLTRTKGRIYFRVSGDKAFIPHGDHGIGGGGDQKVHAFGWKILHFICVFESYFVKCFHFDIFHFSFKFTFFLTVAIQSFWKIINLQNQEKGVGILTQPHGHPNPHSPDKGATIRLVAWEITRNCNLDCMHCRAAATKGPYEGELDTESCLRLLDRIALTGSPIVILTGGEPLMRPDIFEVAKYGTEKGLRMVMAPNGTLITESTAKKMADAGIRRISISIDGPDAQSHDKFRGVTGAFEGAMRGIGFAKNAGIEFQINTTISRINLKDIPAIQKMAVSLGAVAHHIFLLVPTGRGKYILDQEISAEEYEETLNWFYDQRETSPLQLKATCAP